MILQFYSHCFKLKESSLSYRISKTIIWYILANFFISQWFVLTALHLSCFIRFFMG